MGARARLVRISSSIILVSVVFASPFVGAAAGDDPDAEPLIRQGIELRKQGDDTRAEGYLRRAYDLTKIPRAAAQLGLVEYALGAFAKAERHLSEALAADDAWVEAHRPILEDSRAGVRKHLARVEAAGAPPGAAATINGVERINLPADNVLWVAPGAISVQIDSPGHNPVTRSTDVKAGDHMTLDFHLEPGPPPALPVAPSPSIAESATAGPDASSTERSDAATEGRRPLRIAGIATAAGGVALGVAGVVLYEMAGTKVDHINSGTYDNSDLNYKTYNDTGVALMVTGGTAIAAGAALFIVGKLDDAPRGAGVSLNVARGGAFASLGGSF